MIPEKDDDQDQGKESVDDVIEELQELPQARTLPESTLRAIAKWAVERAGGKDDKDDDDQDDDDDDDKKDG